MTSILEVEQLDTLSSNASSTLTIGGTNTTTIAFGPNVTTTPSSLANTPDLSPKNYAIMDMNGTTDYAEAKCFHDKGFSVNTNPINEAINFFGYKLIGA
jgi:hypothetical protein